jgi:hypothetical protein
MPISGLVVSLVSDPQLREEAIGKIRAEPRIEVGAIHANRMAIVLDTPTIEDDKRLWNWLSSLPGVVFVDLAMVAFDSSDPSPSSPQVMNSQGMNVGSAVDFVYQEKTENGR